MFVFYDTETTGLSRDFSQILQVGFLFTDDDMNILSTLKAEGALSPWIVPSPGALLTTGFTPEDLRSRKTSNYEMMRNVEEWLRGKHWPVIFIGYNSLGYDEPVLAQAFYQNLFDAGMTTSANPANNAVNGRADVMRMVEAAFLYTPGALKLDERNYYNTPSLNLKAVASQNGVPLSDEDAHDALNDIKATVGVARVIRKAAPKLWEQMMRLTTARGVDEFIATNKLFTYVSRERADSNKPVPLRATVMTSLADAGDAAQATFDLRFDPRAYYNLSVAQLKAAFLAQGVDKPFSLIAKDEQPILMPMDLSEPVLEKDDDVAVFEARAKALRTHKDFMERVAEAARQARAEQLKPQSLSNAESQIHSKVPAASRVKLVAWIESFHDAADWKERAVLVSGFRETFKKELEKTPELDRYVKLAGRLVYEHAPELLSQELNVGMKRFIAARILNPNPDAPYMTIAKARKELSTIEWQRAKPDNKKWKEVTDTQIRSLKLYYTALEREYSPHSPYAANRNVPPQPEAPEARNYIKGGNSAPDEPKLF